MAMGYSVQSDGALTGDDLVRQADLAMYEAKRGGGRGVELLFPRPPVFLTQRQPALRFAARQPLVLQHVVVDDVFLQRGGESSPLSEHVLGALSNDGFRTAQFRGVREPGRR